jgi:hypothetical protein
MREISERKSGGIDREFCGSLEKVFIQNMT